MFKLIFLLTIFSLSLFANSSVSIINKAETYLEYVEDNEYKRGSSFIFKNSFLNSNISYKKDLESGISNLLNTYGESFGFELLKKIPIGRNVYKLTYIMYAEHTPVIWNFYFYKSNEIWSVTSVSFTKDLSTLSLP